METKTTSGILGLSKSDFLRGLLIAALTTPMTIIYQSLQAGSFSLDWKSILAVALAGGLGYILKNLGTPAEVVIKGASKEEVKAVKEGTAEAIIISK